ncbi:glycosyltransferase family 39 protein [Saccharopolyspora griseoalba]|uniref:Glycosyltransferase family 39 protein n=1 Tax=Saccharopolyspora griseoalba TaxID=1431848 RepID=A0ABW2LHL2_9PSEU
MLTVEQTAAEREEANSAPLLRRLALVGICALAAVLYLWGIGDSWGNGYYSAAVKSMSQSFENFFFGSFDPAGVVTVDKPPMALWLQVISAQIFGYGKFSVLFPQVVCGVLAVFALHRTVRRWAGEHAALIAALVLAVSPITVVINRDNNPDTLLVLLVLAAAYAMTRAIETRRSTGWVALAAFLIGCGFLTKMLQAWMVLPAFAAAYLICSRHGWVRRLADLGVAAAVLFVSSFWWVLATEMWPSPKPYIGGSTDGSALDLVFGYNGFGRILGGEGNGAGGGPGGGGPGGGGAGFSGSSGVLRMFNDQLAGQISWLLPLCALLLVTMLVVGVRHWRSEQPLQAGATAGWLLWGGWLGVLWVMFSFARGTMHPYYTTMMAPAIGAITGAGLVRSWGWYRQPGRAWLLLPAGVVVTVAWAMSVVARDLTWHAWAGYLAVALGGVVVVALVLGRFRGGAARAGLVLGMVAMLTVPTTWSAIGALAGGRGTMGGANPTAGPSTMSGDPGGGGPGGNLPGSGEGLMPSGDQPPGEGSGGQSGSGSRPGPPGGVGGETLSSDQQKVLEHVRSIAGEKKVPLAIEGGSMGSASYIINSDLTVIGMGGFTGSDDAPSVQQLTGWKNNGELGFVVLGGGIGGPGGRGGGPGAQGGGSGGQDRRGEQAQRPEGTTSSAGDRMPGGGQERDEREQWVEDNCTEVDPAAYGATPDSALELYSCS